MHSYFMEYQCSQVHIYLTIGIVLLFLGGGSFCKHSSSAFTELGSCNPDLNANNPTISSLPCFHKYITEAYFEKHDSLLDLAFQDFIANELPLGFCEVLQDRLNFVPRLSVLHWHLIGEGSHCRLSSSIIFESQPNSISDLSSHFCEAIIVERLPSGVFADPFELQHLVQRGVFTDASAFGDTNLELPAVRSNRSIVEVHMDIGPNILSGNKNGLEFNMELPLHARYPPLGEHGYSRVEFGSPDLLMCCIVKGNSNNESCIFVSTDNSAKSKAGARLGSTLWNYGTYRSCICTYFRFSNCIGSLYFVGMHLLFRYCRPQWF